MLCARAIILTSVGLIDELMFYRASLWPGFREVNTEEIREIGAAVWQPGETISRA